jgi:hypothetical protein
MPLTPRLLPLVLAFAPLGRLDAQNPHAGLVIPVDTSAIETDDEGVPMGLQFGVAGGALEYPSGRGEQALGAVVRWAPQRWLSLAATPSAVRVREVATVTGPATSRSGLTDLPLEAVASRTFAIRFAPTLSLGFGATLPLGDTAAGLGTGRVGYSASTGLGFAPAEGVWAHLGAGRSLSGFSPRSAFTGGSGWGDASAGFSLNERLSLSGGYGTDLGAVDPTVGRSASVEGGLAVSLRGHETMHLNASHGVSGAAPRWGLGVAFGTAFPYLNHLGAGSSLDQLSQSFGGGSHGLGGGTSGSTSSGRGRGRV